MSRPWWFAWVIVVAPAVYAGTPNERPILEMLAWMEHQASLVDSARAEFTVTFLPTTREEMERISALCKYRGNEFRAGGYYLSAHQARRRNYHSVWFRKGICEREEKTYIARPAIVETTVFDGQDVRTLDGTPGRTYLSISSPAASWVPKSRVQPFSFAFEFRSASHSELVRNATDRSARRDVATQSSEITLRHPDETRLMLRLVFDNQRRLVTREAIFTQTTSLMQLDHDQPDVYSRHEYSQFKPYDVGEGRRLWFPSKATLRYYLGRLPDGSSVQAQAIEVDVRDIEFNLDVPDEKFTIRAPEGVPVHDRRNETYGAVPLTY